MGFAARVKLRCCFSPQKSSNRSLISGEYKQLRPHPPHRHAHCQSCPIFPSHRDLSYASQTICSRFLNHILPAMTEIRNQLPNCRRYHKPSLNPEVCLRNVAGKPNSWMVCAPPFQQLLVQSGQWSLSGGPYALIKNTDGT